MAAQPDNDNECPVCHELFTVPKLLPCYHLACKDCVRSWLDKGGAGGCPLCRAPILSPTPSGQGDLDSLVDSLPTDLLTESLVKGHQVVTGPHVCAVCPGSMAATSYCFDCDVKLCATCSTQHRKIPASRDHILHGLNTLTAEEVSARCRSPCQNHQGRPAQVYCSDHHELICWECTASRHRSCAEVKGVGDVAKEKRRELDRRIRGWRTKGAALVQQIQSRKEEFNKQRRYVKEVFDDIQRHAEKRRQQLYDIIQEQEDRDIDLEKTRAAVTSHTITMDHLQRSGADDVMLQMMNVLEPRSKEVDAECGRAENPKAVKDLQLNSQKITHIKSSLSALGEEGADHSVTATVTSPSPAVSVLTHASAGTPVVTHTVPAVPPAPATTTTTATTHHHHHTPSLTAGCPGSVVPNTTAVVASGSVVNPSSLAGTAVVSTISVPVTIHSTSALRPDVKPLLAAASVVTAAWMSTQYSITSIPVSTTTQHSTPSTISSPTCQDVPVSAPVSAAVSVVTASLPTIGTTTTTTHTTSAISTPSSSAASVTASVHAGETMDVASTSAVRTNTTLPVTKDTTYNPAKLSLVTPSSATVRTSTTTSPEVPTTTHYPGQASSVPPPSPAVAASGGDAGAAAVTGAVLLGTARSRPSALSSPKPRGAALAKVLKVGDRVRLRPGRGLDWGDRGPGTVTAIPSARAVALYGKSAQGKVDVRWDKGGEVYCCMGFSGLYELELL